MLDCISRRAKMDGYVSYEDKNLYGFFSKPMVRKQPRRYYKVRQASGGRGDGEATETEEIQAQSERRLSQLSADRSQPAFCVGVQRISGRAAADQ